MSTYTQLYYHIIFSTKHRTRCLWSRDREMLFKYIHGTIKNKGCHLYRINGVEDHIHIFMGILPSIAISDIIKDLKLATSQWIKEQNIFRGFDGWQDGYAAFTYSGADKDKVIEYIKNQEEHHRKRTYLEEVKAFLKEFNVEYDERYLN